jgi:hypothetical protein
MWRALCGGNINNDHIVKRHTPIGRWLPASLYVINLVGWFVGGAMADASHLVWLVVLPLPPLILYLVRTRRRAA